MKRQNRDDIIVSKQRTAAGERLLFSQRLETALVEARHKTGPTHVARLFNANFDGKPVTVHGVRKWLVGEAIPTQDKVRVLAQLCAVPLNWLLFGEGRDGPRSEASVQPQNAALAMAIERLSDYDQQIVADFVKMLGRPGRQRVDIAT